MSLVDRRWLLAQATERLPAGKVLFIDADELVQDIARTRPDITPIVFSTARTAWLADKLPRLAGVCMGFNQAKQLVRLQLTMLAECVPVGTPLWLYGGGRAGIASAGQLLADHWHHVSKLAYGGHAELWGAQLAEAAPARGLAAWEERHVYHVAGQDLVLISLPGVFSHGEVDDGTRLLLTHLPLLPAGARVHDFGHGCGIIAAWLKRRQPDLRVSGSDISAMAHEAAKATLRANDVREVPLYVEAGLGKIPGPLDVIVSNPPFHSGQKTDMSISEDLFRTAAQKLAPGGLVYIVGNRFLPYRTQLEQLIGPTEVLADDKRFWVLAARKGARRVAK